MAAKEKPFDSIAMLVAEDKTTQIYVEDGYYQHAYAVTRLTIIRDGTTIRLKISIVLRQ